ncbi:MAG: hypothetical protein LBJ46_06655 [Planctomycetota bacterium]|nr:hypothetical protein [Planctomycetota bacterium]
MRRGAVRRFPVDVTGAPGDIQCNQLRQPAHRGAATSVNAPRIVVLGSLLYGCLIRVDRPPRKGETAASDAFNSAFSRALAVDTPVREAAPRFANAAGAYAAARAGSQPSPGTLTDIERVLLSLPGA